MIAISRTGRVLRRLVRLSCRRPAVTVAISLVLAAAAVAYTAARADLQDLHARRCCPRTRATCVRYTEYAREFGELEDIVVVVEAGSFEGAKAYAARLVRGAAAGAGQVPAGRLPDRSQAVRGPPAPLPLDRRAAGDPRQDLRPPGVHGELRGRPEPGPPARGREHPDGRRLRLQPLRPRAPGQGPAGGHALPAACSWTRSASRLERPDALPLALGHALLLRRGPARRRRLLPLRRQEPALHPGGDPAEREGQLHRRPGAPSRRSARRSPGCGRPSPTCRPASPGRRPSPTTR